MKRVNHKELLQLLSRVWSGPVKELSGKQAEEKMTNLLREKLPQAKSIEVTDISGTLIIVFQLFFSSTFLFDFYN